MTCAMYEREISEAAETAEEPALARSVVRSVHNGLELPEGFQAEIMEGQIFIGATPNIKHARIIRSIDVALTAALPEAYECYQVVAGQEPEGDRRVPDLGVWPVDMVDEESEAWLMDTADPLVAVEVASAGQEDRDHAKAAGYARAGVPSYFPMDRRRRRCILHTEPAAGSYRTIQPTDFGKPVTLPLETPVELGTEW